MKIWFDVESIQAQGPLAGWSDLLGLPRPAVLLLHGGRMAPVVLARALIVVLFVIRRAEKAGDVRCEMRGASQKRAAVLTLFLKKLFLFPPTGSLIKAPRARPRMAATRRSLAIVLIVHSKDSRSI